MSGQKRKGVRFEESTTSDSAKRSRFKNKHSLDSDEEEDGDENAAQLSDEDVDGQEEKTIDFSEGGIRVTPFNLKEEMEEGHFDADGHYIADKDAGAVEDSWLETVDWQEVHEKAAERELDDLGGDEDDDEENETIDKLSILRAVIEIVKPGETVAKALRRLGGSDKDKAGRAKKTGKSYDLFADEEETNKTDKSVENKNTSKEAMLRLTELADQLVQIGYDDIYGDTYEKLAYQVRQCDENKGTAKEESGSNVVSEEVMWQYKWQKEDHDVHGPFTSSQMQEWVDKDYFKNGVWVRKVGEGNQEFYSSKRIDFSLYVD
jgi:CD2 antigen cytoplasmic tail-binding protein 2